MKEKQLAIDAESVEIQNALQKIKSLQHSYQIDTALKFAQTLVNTYPNSLASNYINYHLAVALKDFVKAEEYLKVCISLQSNHPLLLLNYAQLNLNSYKYSVALEHARKAFESYRGRHTGFLSAIAKVMMQVERPDQAIEVYLKILDISPSELQAMHELALCYFFMNNVEKAEALLNQVIIRAPQNAGAIHLRSALKTYSKSTNHIDELKQLATHKAEAHPAVYYALAKELEDIGEFDESFEYLKLGAGLMRKKVNYDERAELSSIENIVNVTLGTYFEDIKDNNPGPIFIVGMPRTGTTLVERILSQHEHVHSLGEFSLFPQLLGSMANEVMAKNKQSVKNLHDAVMQIDFAELGRRYTDAASEISGGAIVTIDKLPVNFLYCGFIKKALPKAKIVHLCRNSMDTCYAIYKTLFINAYSFSYDLEELANYYISYRQIMDHWHHVMPGQILDIQYEDLVMDAEQVAKRLVEWCGMSFKSDLLNYYQTDSVSTTASAAQIRKPIYTTSVQKWLRVERHLSVLKEKLKASGLDV